MKLKCQPSRTNTAIVNAMLNVMVVMAKNEINTLPDVSKRTTSAIAIDAISDAYVPSSEKK